MIPRLVLVVWKDAGGRSGWNDLASTLDWFADESNFLITSVGFVGDENEDFLLVFPSVSNDKVLDPIAIPQSSILFIEDINLPEGVEDEETE